MSEPLIDLLMLPRLGALFKDLSAGKHLNRVTNSECWAELEREQAAYDALFTALGYCLVIDPRGFAWFEQTDAANTLSSTSRQLALVFMVIFDTQATAGKSLKGFMDWRLDRALLAQAHEANVDLLEAESLSVEGLCATLTSATKLGFTDIDESGHWMLLPATHRYLDHFEVLASHALATREARDTLSDDPNVESLA